MAADDKSADQAGADGEKKGGIDEYLSAPKKKRKNYVVMAIGKGIDQDIPIAIQGYLKSNFDYLTQSYPRNTNELSRHVNRIIKLLIFDDEFCPLEKGMETIATMKQKKRRQVLPVLFLTSDQKRLTELYNKILLPYHEGDDYVNYVKSPVSQILSKVSNGLKNLNRRRSRRYRIDIPITYFSLSANRMMEGRILDLSVHGALLKCDDPGYIFREQEQVKLSLPVSGDLVGAHGDFLKISAKVRRVLISGNHAGVSFEHMTDRNLTSLTYLLTDFVNNQISRKARGRPIGRR